MYIDDSREMMRLFESIVQNDPDMQGEPGDAMTIQGLLEILKDVPGESEIQVVFGGEKDFAYETLSGQDMFIIQAGYNDRYPYSTQKLTAGWLAHHMEKLRGEKMIYHDVDPVIGLVNQEYNASDAVPVKDVKMEEGVLVLYS